MFAVIAIGRLMDAPTTTFLYPSEMIEQKLKVSLLLLLLLLLLRYLGLCREPRILAQRLETLGTVVRARFLIER